MSANEERRKIACNSCYWNGMEDENVQREIKRFAKQGAVAALEELGFYDSNGKIDRDAVKDFGEVRGMLKDWREFKASTWRAIAKWVMYIALGLLAIKLGVADLLKAGKP
jgi:hypothetical protein